MPEITQLDKTQAGGATHADVNEAQIAVHWKEEEYYHPNAKFVGQANLTDPSVTERFSIDKFPECFKEYADMLSWDQYWHTTLDTSNAPFWRWFVGGKLNASYNCVDRHLAKDRNKAALSWVPQPEGACGGRIADSGSRVLITMDAYYRSGDLLDHKVKADEAVAAARKEGQEVDKVLVWRRYPGQYSAKTPMVEGRDVFVDEVLADYQRAIIEP